MQYVVDEAAKLTQLAQSTLPFGSLRVNLIETAKHVVPTAEYWRTGVQIPPAPPNPKKDASGRLFLWVESSRYRAFSTLSYVEAGSLLMKYRPNKGVLENELASSFGKRDIGGRPTLNQEKGGTSLVAMNTPTPQSEWPEVKTAWCNPQLKTTAVSITRRC